MPGSSVRWAIVVAPGIGSTQYSLRAARLALPGRRFVGADRGGVPSIRDGGASLLAPGIAEAAHTRNWFAVTGRALEE